MSMPVLIEDLLRKGCLELGLEPSDVQIRQFGLFYEALIEKNKVMNLTAITEPEDVTIKHFLDSLSIVKAVDFSHIQSVLDIGTGAGFPGIPLKIMFPSIRFVLLDSLNKRVKFLNEVIELCRFENISAVHGRAEDLARQKNYRESFDLCVSRAVANLSSLSEYCLPFVKKEGRFVSYKSGNIEGEFREAGTAVRLLGGKMPEEPCTFTLPCSDLTRSMIVIRKVRETPRAYPRKAGVPVKNPL